MPSLYSRWVWGGIPIQNKLYHRPVFEFRLRRCGTTVPPQTLLLKAQKGATAAAPHTNVATQTSACYLVCFDSVEICKDLGGL